MPSATVYYDFEIDGKTVEFEVEATFSPEVSASRSGHPDNWSPAEGGDMEEMTVSLVHAHTKDGKTTHTTEPCSETQLFELLVADNEGWTMDKAESEVQANLAANAENNEPEGLEADFDDDDSRDDYIHEGY